MSGIVCIRQQELAFGRPSVRALAVSSSGLSEILWPALAGLAHHPDRDLCGGSPRSAKGRRRSLAVAKSPWRKDVIPTLNAPNAVNVHSPKTRTLADRVTMIGRFTLPSPATTIA